MKPSDKHRQGDRQAGAGGWAQGQDPHQIFSILEMRSSQILVSSSFSLVCRRNTKPQMQPPCLGQMPRPGSRAVAHGPLEGAPVQAQCPPSAPRPSPASGRASAPSSGWPGRPRPRPGPCCAPVRSPRWPWTSRGRAQAPCPALRPRPAPRPPGPLLTAAACLPPAPSAPGTAGLLSPP